MADNPKLTVRVPRKVLEDARRYARAHDTTLTRLISEYLRRLPASAPIVRRLSGTLSPQVTSEDYRKHVDESCGDRG